ncbi:uncharacterized protein LOC123470261 [Daphnia magna]|uniref:uncharacterized protein LOC123470261 n=1 Tax=Daphnia magna TaxID=35525 RepID=UPI001E1BC26A|nr:uncharacterized protein LOC123470261 [Daphnia magna]
MDCLYELRQPVSQVCEELGWDELSNSDWIMLKSIIDLLRPFAAYTQLVSADKYVTFSSAVPCIEELKLHLQRSAEKPGLNGVACAMLSDLTKRFDFMTKEDDPEFDIYLLATCLDCNYRFFVIDEPDVQKVVLNNVVKIAKQLGLKYCANQVQNGNNASGAAQSSIEESQESEETQSATTTQNTDGYKDLNPSSFRLLLEKKKAKRSSSSNDHSRSSSAMSTTTTDLNAEIENHQLTSIEEELLDYFNLVSRMSSNLPTSATPMQDSIDFWKDNAERFPFLKNLAYNVLSIPASSAAAEREFSASGWHTLGRKNRTTGETLSAKVFLTCNKDILRPLFF